MLTKWYNIYMGQVFFLVEEILLTKEGQYVNGIDITLCGVGLVLMLRLYDSIFLWTLWLILKRKCITYAY